MNARLFGSRLRPRASPIQQKAKQNLASTDPAGDGRGINKGGLLEFYSPQNWVARGAKAKTKTSQQKPKY